MDNELINLQTDTYGKVRETIITARNNVYTAVNFAMVQAYWEIGKEIFDAQDGNSRAEYGKGLLEYLSVQLTAEFGKGFTIANLRNMRQFYLTFQNRYALRSELSWTHYRLLMRIDNEDRRTFYMNECVDCNWSSRQLERQINSFYYERLLATQKTDREEVRNEIQTTEPKITPDYILKDPYILEFLQLGENKKYLESELEQGLINNLQDFLLELGKGFSLAARQKRITIDCDHYYIDLVFYNYILKCFVLIDLKTGKLSYQDIGQIDFYVRYFEENMKQPGDNPTIGIVLCSDKNEAMVKYSILEDSKQLFASKYQLYIPTEEELKRELERERRKLEQAIADEKETL
jgi:predicted nuclease of restriction endonuclease-like (RecB) superfamily